MGARRSAAGDHLHVANAVILAIDCGLSAVKVSIADLDGQILARERVAYPTVRQGDKAEQEPADWWRSIAAALARLPQRGEISVSSRLAICTASFLLTKCCSRSCHVSRYTTAAARSFWHRSIPGASSSRRASYSTQAFLGKASFGSLRKGLLYLTGPPPCWRPRIMFRQGLLAAS